MLNRLLRASPYVVVQLAAIYLYQVAGRIEFPAAPGRIGPDFWPKSILVLLGLVCVYEIIKNLLIGETFTAAGLLEKLMKDSGANEAEEKLRSYPLLLAGGIVLTIIYVATIDKLGFFLATIGYLALFMVIGRYRRWGVIAIASVLGALGLMFIFMKVVYVSLPLGVEPFSAVSLWLLATMGVH
ncbi:MAG: tripartite tricarboxylate transporter TctB family protein [Sulfuritalea sp.]|nr:tripartite tricarboxylate transporter TctB family protein [Sulfuritalea sp.]